MQFYEKQCGDYLISTDPTRIDFDVVYDFLDQQSYWAKGMPRTVLAKAIQNSLTFGVYRVDENQQVGFGRIVTDWATFAYLSDVFILPAFRGKGLSKNLVQAMLDHPDLQGLRRWLLITADAHTLYQRFGFELHPNPQNIMQIHDPNVYDIYKNPEP